MLNCIVGYEAVTSYMNINTHTRALQGKARQAKARVRQGKGKARVRQGKSKAR